MPFSKIKYNRGQGIFKLRIEDSSGSLIENWVVMQHDFLDVVDIISNKYGLKRKGFGLGKDKDLDWAI
jgi:hypothetical protein